MDWQGRDPSCLISALSIRFSNPKIRKKHHAHVRKLLKNGADPNQRKKNKFLLGGAWTPLTVAAGSGDSLMVCLLLSQPDIQVDKTNEQGFTPFIFACQENHVNIVNILLSKGSNINATTRNKVGGTGFYLACKNGNVELMKLLLSKGALLTPNKMGGTPFFIACMQGRVEAVKFLIKINADIGKLDNMKQTPLMAASDGGGPRRSGSSEMGQCGVLKILLSLNIEVDQCDMYGNTALIVASQNNHPKAVKLLISNGASVVSSCGSYALYIASSLGHLKIIKILVLNGADVNATPKKTGGCSSLMYACQNAHFDVLKFLLTKGADIEHQSDDGQNALTIACGEPGTNNADVVKTLINYGANVNPILVKNMSPLYLASGAGYTKIVNLLLKNGANVNVCCAANHSTPLMFASQEGHTKICRLLIKYGADMSASHRGTQGTSTAATSAGAFGHKETLALLKRRSQKCALCGSTAQEKNKKALNRCSSCGLVFYCDRDCQLKHWKNGHKETCKKLNQSNPPTTTTTNTRVVDSGLIVERTIINPTLVCAMCSTPETPDHKLNRCKCRTVYYCNITCQRNQWADHQTKHRLCIKKLNDRKKKDE